MIWKCTTWYAILWDRSMSLIVSLHILLMNINGIMSCHHSYALIIHDTQVHIDTILTYNQTLKINIFFYPLGLTGHLPLYRRPWGVCMAGGQSDPGRAGRALGPTGGHRLRPHGRHLRPPTPAPDRNPLTAGTWRQHYSSTWL